MGLVRRRQFLLASGALLAAPRAAAQTKRVPRIGLLPEAGIEWRNLVTGALRGLGWTEAREYALVELGLQYGQVQADSAAKRMVAANPDLILTINTAFALAAHQLSSSIPIVMALSGYPVEVGLAHSLARPGKNVTGNSIYAGTGIWGKLPELLREAKPSLKRLGVLWDYVPPGNPRAEVEPCYQELRQAERKLGLALNLVEVADPGRVTAALAAIDAGRPDALLVASGTGLFEARSRVMKFAVERRLPTITDYRWFEDVEPYPLLVYAPLTPPLLREAASYAIRILAQGAKPGDLPIQLPAKFELVVNRRNARAIGLALPQALLLRADQVIE